MNCLKPRTKKPHSHSSLQEAWIPAHWLGLGCVHAHLNLPARLPDGMDRSCSLGTAFRQRRYHGYFGECYPLVTTPIKNVLEAAGMRGIPLPWRGKPKSQDEVGRDWISRGITGDLPTPLSYEVLQLALSAWYLKEMGQAMGLDKSQSLEMSLCSITFEFLPCYDRSSLFTQAELNLSFPIVGGAQGKVFGALIFGPFPKAFSLHPSQQSPPILANHKKRLLSCYQLAKHLLLLFGILWWWGWQGIWLASQDLLYLIHCVSDLGPLPSTHSRTLYSIPWLWLVSCQLYFFKVQ